MSTTRAEADGGARPARSARWPGYAALVLLAGGCALEAGDHFAELTEVQLQAAFSSPADRQLSGGWHRLASDFQVRLETCTLSASGVELLDRGGTGGHFDPAQPPPGYSLCHNGHCHAADGRLVPYEEIAAGLGQGGAAPRAVVSLPVGDLDLLAGERHALECTPACGLPRVHLTRLRIPTRRLEIVGLVRDGRTVAPRISGEVPLRIELETGGVALGTAIDLAADRSHPPRIELAIELAVTPALLDVIEWHAIERSGETIRIDESSPAGQAEVAAELRERLTAAALTVAVQRRD
jgi:hypothetical protein